MFPNPVASRAHHTQRMGLVDHQEGAVPALHFDEAGQVGVIPVHAVDAFQHDQDTFELVALLIQDRVQRFPVVVREGQAACAG
ncbi:hypothetical protein D3C72_2092020 [compost metagenome]